MVSSKTNTPAPAKLYSSLVLEWTDRDPVRALEDQEADVPAQVQAYDNLRNIEAIRGMRRFQDPKILKWIDDIPDEASLEVNVWGSEV